MKRLYLFLLCISSSLLSMDPEHAPDEYVPSVVSYQWGRMQDASVLDDRNIVVAAGTAYDTDRHSLVCIDTASGQQSLIAQFLGSSTTRGLMGIGPDAFLRFDGIGHCVKYQRDQQQQWRYKTLFFKPRTIVAALCRYAPSESSINLYALDKQGCFFKVNVQSGVMETYRDFEQELTCGNITVHQSGQVAMAYVPVDNAMMGYVCDSWDTHTRDLKGHTDAINDIVVSQDARSVYTASDDGRVCMWDTVSGQLMRTIFHVPDRIIIKFDVPPPLLPDFIVMRSDLQPDTEFLFQNYNQAQLVRESCDGNTLYVSGAGMVAAVDKRTNIPFYYYDTAQDYQYNPYECVVPIVTAHTLLLCAYSHQRYVPLPEFARAQVSSAARKQALKGMGGNITSIIAARQIGQNGYTNHENKE